MDKLEIGLLGNKNTNIIRHIQTDRRQQKIINEYKDLFKNNHTTKDLTIDIQLKKDTKPIQQKGRPVPIHFQKTVKHDLEKLIGKGNLEKADKTTENCSISPAVITIKKDKYVKIALDSRTLNEARVKRMAAMPNMEELIIKISAEFTEKRGNLDVKNRLGLRLWAGKTIQRSSKTLFIINNWRRLHWPLPIQERLSWAVAYINRIPRAY